MKVHPLNTDEDLEIETDAQAQAQDQAQAQAQAQAEAGNDLIDYFRALEREYSSLREIIAGLNMFGTSVEFNSFNKLDEKHVFHRLFQVADRTHMIFTNDSKDPVYLMAYEDINIEGKSIEEIAKIFKDRNPKNHMHHLDCIRLDFKSKHVCLFFLFPKKKEIKYISLDVEKYSMVIV